MAKKQDGFIAKIVLIVVALVLVKYFFEFDIVKWYQSPTTQKYVETIWNLIKTFYNWVDNFIRTKFFS